ncbi:alpha/beta hydrolase [Nocardiopsis sp. EMB25]|uniref:alpha/beta hydrolase family protein n=1 Tax=Nocardiopsis sp. EMB25 TaxID=2835867 RepID=UPI002284460A|nr:alpha/beta hydrolase [Nocardiopsis sp. EMB25]MCY9785063.1 alpha/beta hydrolase [Nocardiopsis sp. EMB25]
MPTTLTYGEHPSQTVHRWAPADGADRPAPVAVLLHGGWWRDLHDARLMEPLARDLSAAGWDVWNVEYRRTGADGGGWPRTRDDVARALELLAETIDREDGALDASRVASVGHSAGGHLALLTAVDSPVTDVVALAPITDLRRCADAGLGEGAVEPFLGPDPDPGLYETTSPRHRLPVGVPQLVVHGDADDRVPVAHSRDYVAAARAAGDAVDYREVAGADHFAVIDPAHPAWGAVRDRLDRR